jgi:hypothetical protein
MAGAGHRTWVAGEVIQANNVQQYLMDQAVQVYNNSGARGSALVGFLSEGMVSYLKSPDGISPIEYFDGTDWQNIIPDALPAELIETNTATKTANYTISATDKNSFLLVNGGITVTINDVLLPGESINFVQTTSGTVTFSAGSAVTILSKGSKTKMADQYAGSSLVAGGAGNYYLVGDLK